MHTILPALLLAAAQAVPFTLDRLELDLQVDHEKERVEGVARLTVRNVSDVPAHEVPFLLNRLMIVTAAGGLPFTQQVLTFEDDSRLQVDVATGRLPEPLAPHSSRTIALSYGGHIASYEETGRLYVKDRVSEEYTIVREDAYSFPVLGVPSLERNRRIPREGFTFDARVTVARGYVVAAGSPAGRVESADSTTYRSSSQSVPFASYGTAGMTDASYGVGQLYFFVLERVVGREALLGALRDLCQSKKVPGASFRDFTTLLEARFPKAGKVDAD